MNLIFLLIPFQITAIFPGQDPWKNVYTETAWAARDSWQKAAIIISKLRITSGSHVADLGCHEGYMTVKLSKTVGTKGAVFAADVEQAKLDKLKTHLEERKITNVIAVRCDFDDPKLPVGTLDAVLILDTYHEMKAHDKILGHIRASLKSGGRLVICEPIASERRDLPREGQERKHELGMSFALQDLRKAGYQIVFSQDPFVDREKIKGDKMWIIVAAR